MKTAIKGVGRVVLRAGALALVLAVAMPSGVSATMHEVPYDCATIQACVDMAAAGDTVYVHSGTYHEHVTIGTQLVLLGEDRETTVIDGDGTGDIVYVTTSDVVIAGFTITNGDKGIYCSGAARSYISDCTVVHNRSDGIKLISSASSQVHDCEISDTYSTDPTHGFALHAHDCSNSHFEGIRLFNNANHRTFVPYHSSGTVIRDLELFNNAGWAIVAGFGSYDMADLYVHDTDNGIAFNGASGCHLASSLFRSIDGQAIQLIFYSQGNLIEGNVIESNGYGVVIGNPSVRNNHFYHNDFIDNVVHVPDGAPGHPGPEDQYWHDGYPSGGNYWSDYSGDDLMSGPGQDVPGSDGIGDTPYWMTALAADIYPLMECYNCLHAIVDVDPDVVNCRSSGPVTCYIELPEGNDPADIDLMTVTLNDTLQAFVEPTSVGDYDGDGTPDLMVKFSRVDVIDLLPVGDEVEVVIGGELTDGTAFVGADVIRVICKRPPSDANPVSPPGLKVVPGDTGSSTILSYTVAKAGPVTLRVYDVSGKLVRTVVSGHRTAGHYEVAWDERSDAGRSVSSGVYFIRLDGSGETVAAKVVVLR